LIRRHRDHSAETSLVSEGRLGSVLLAQRLVARPTRDPDFFTAPEYGHVPAARDAWRPQSARVGASAQRKGSASVRQELYTHCMADPITFRPTAEDTENLAILTADGTSPTHAIRHALEIAAHNKRQEDLRADAARLAASPEYQAEIRAVREELDELRAW
jgi:hypothetical protein